MHDVNSNKNAEHLGDFDFEIEFKPGDGWAGGDLVVNGNVARLNFDLTGSDRDGVEQSIGFALGEALSTAQVLDGQGSPYSIRRACFDIAADRARTELLARTGFVEIDARRAGYAIASAVCESLRRNGFAKA